MFVFYIVYLLSRLTLGAPCGFSESNFVNASISCDIIPRAPPGLPDIKNYFQHHYYYEGPNGHDPAKMGCAPYHDDLSNSFNEAAAVVRKTVMALEDLKQKRPPRSRNVFKDNTPYTLWNRHAQAMKAYLGINMDPEKGGGIRREADKHGKGEDNSWFSFGFVSDLFEKMDNDFQNGVPGFSRNSLLCGDKGWRLFKPEDPDPTNPSQKIIDIKLGNKPRYPKGAWAFEGMKMPGTFDLCSENVIAMASDDARLIMWCPAAWASNSKTLPSKANKDATFDDPLYHSLSSTWIHEFAHYYGSGDSQLVIDQPAVTTKGQPVYDSDKPGGTTDPGPPGKPNQRMKTYGVVSTMNLSRGNPAFGYLTADAYRFFALSVWFDKLNWSRGEATNDLGL